MSIHKIERYGLHSLLGKDTQMQLDSSRWFVRWYFWSQGIWDEFSDRSDLWRVEEKGTNLCHFMRVTLVWAPLVLLLNIAVYGAAIASLTVVPVVLFGFTFYLSLIGALATIALIVWAIKRDRTTTPERQPLETRTRATEPVVEKPRVGAGPGFWKTLWLYLVAVKAKVCPTITFNGAEGQAS